MEIGREIQKMNPQYIKSSIIVKRIAELEEERYSSENKEIIDAQILVLKEMLKPQ